MFDDLVLKGVEARISSWQEKEIPKSKNIYREGCPLRVIIIM
jgi:hypothetical protein